MGEVDSTSSTRGQAGASLLQRRPSVTKNHPWRSIFLSEVGMAAVVSATLVVFGLYEWIVVPIVLGVVVGVLGYVMMLADRRTITLGNVLSVGLLSSYSLGYLLSLISTKTLTSQALAGWKLAYSATPASLLAAITVVLFAATLCAVVGGSHRLAVNSSSNAEFADPSPIRSLILGLSIVGVAIAMGKMGFMGTINVSGTVPALGAVGTLILAPIGLTALHRAATERGRQRVTLLVLFALAQVMLVPMGRRTFAYSLLLAPVLWFAAKRKERRDRSMAPKVARMAVGISVAVFLAFSVFFSMREYGNQFGLRGDKLAAYELVVGGLSLLAEHPAIMTEKLTSSIGPRSGSLLVYLGLHIDRLSPRNQLNGRVALLSARMAVPRLVWQNKSALVAAFGSSEALTHSAMGLSAFDGPNTILTEGYADFGVIGALAYPLLIVMLYSLFLALVEPAIGFHARVFVEIAVLLTLLATEGTISGYLTNLRNLALVVIVIVAAQSLRRSKGRQRLP